jgi:uncharacterized phage-associated protein
MVSTPPLPKSKAHDARAIANYFLDLAARDGVSVDPLKIQKLVYIAHGWHLAITGDPLIYQTVMAWKYGPVIRDVYRAFRGYGGNVIDGRATAPPDWEHTTEPRPYSAELSERSRAVLNDVWKWYGRYTGVELSAITHDFGTPWDQVAGRLPDSQIKDLVIPEEAIERYYIQLADRKRVANGAG